MAPNIPVILGSHVPQVLSLVIGIKMMKATTYFQVTSALVLQWLQTFMAPPCPQGLLPSWISPRSQISHYDPSRDLKKCTVFTLEQNLVLQEHFDNGMHPTRSNACHWLKDLTWRSPIPRYVFFMFPFLLIRQPLPSSQPHTSIRPVLIVPYTIGVPWPSSR